VPEWSTSPITVFCAMPTTAAVTPVSARTCTPSRPTCAQQKRKTKPTANSYTIYNGIRLSGMPAFGEKDQSDAESTWQLVRFIRHLPSLTPEEEQQMQSLNPQSPMEQQEKNEEEEFLKGGTPPKSMRIKHH
jgi:hypothetical protein